MKDKFLRLLGLSRRAGKLTLGAEKSAESVKKNRAKAIFFACDISPKTRKEIDFILKTTQITSHVTKYGIEEISDAIGAPAGVVAVEDDGFAKALINEL